MHTNGIILLVGSAQKTEFKSSALLYLRQSTRMNKVSPAASEIIWNKKKISFELYFALYLVMLGDLCFIFN